MAGSARDQAALLPTTPGVYRFRDASGRALYLGRATSLRSRVASYWGDLRGRAHLRRMVARIATVEAVACDSVHEAAWLERNLLRAGQPPWNRAPEGGRESEVWIRLSDAPRAPGVTVVYQRTGAGRHFGPYLGGRQVRLAVSGLCRVFPLSYTGSGLAGTSHALAALRGVTGADRVTLAGHVSAVLDRDPAAVARLQASLTGRRAAAAGNLAFELAARLQQEIEAVDWVTAEQKVTRPDQADLEVCGWSDGTLVRFAVRGGRLSGWTQRACREPAADLARTPPEWAPFARRNAELAARLRAPNPIRLPVTRTDAACPGTPPPDVQARPAAPTGSERPKLSCAFCAARRRVRTAVEPDVRVIRVPPRPGPRAETQMIIDCHGHYTTAPAALQEFRDAQLARLRDPALPVPAAPPISDDDIRASIEGNQLRIARERGHDLTIFSPRASSMAHHVPDPATAAEWARVCNDLIYRVTTLFPANFAGVAQLPQVAGEPLDACVRELDRVVTELGFVGCNLNPDPSGGYWSSPPLTDPYWFPLYEKMTELDVPAMIHVSTSCNPAAHTLGAHYLNADTTAFMQLVQGDLFDRFPALRFIIPHGGGAVPYHWGRFQGIATREKFAPVEQNVMRNVCFDTCVYHQPGIDLLTSVISADNILFASEMLGAVRGDNPDGGFPWDDTKRYVEAAKLADGGRARIFELNARRVYPRLDARLKAQGR